MIQFTKKFITKNVKIDSNGCWIWQGSLYGNGYPRIVIDGVTYLLTRVSLHIFKGFDLESTLDACHDDSKCYSRACINPEHLFSGSRSDNMINYHEFRGRRWNSEKTHCKNGHEFNKKNTYLYGGKRQCKQCKKLRQQSSLKKVGN